MTQVIIYPTRNSGTICIVYPIDPSFDIHDLALRDVPEGYPFLIIDESELPDDPSFRSAWVANFSVPDGHGIGFENYEKTVENRKILAEENARKLELRRQQEELERQKSEEIIAAGEAAVVPRPKTPARRKKATTNE